MLILRTSTAVLLMLASALLVTAHDVDNERERHFAAKQIWPILRDISVFEWLSDGYKTFGVPGIVQSANGTLIAATEGRVATTRPAVGNASLCYGVLASKYDSGCVDKDIVIKLSSDGGERWRTARALTESNATHFCSNPNLLPDRNSSVVWMVYYECLVAEVYRHCIPVMTSSKENGVTWSSGKLIDVGPSLHIGGLGGGIQLTHQDGEGQGRLIFPHHGLGVIYSDDHGQTWKAGSKVHDASGENQAAELADGSVLMSLRNAGLYCPTFCKSHNGGLTYTDCEEKESVLSSLMVRASLVQEKLNSVDGISCNPVEGAMYAFPRVTIPQKAIDYAKYKGMEADSFYCMELLSATGVYVVPGCGFNQAPDTYHFLTTILPPEDLLTDMMDCIASFHRQFTQQYS